MGLQKREEEYAKELDDVGYALVELVKDIKAKKPVAEIAGENLPNLMNALNGMDQLDDELDQHRAVALRTLGAHLGGLVDALLPEKVAAPVPPAA